MARCCVCNAVPATFCPNCNSAAYCSTECKQDDARGHQLLCADFATFIDVSTRPPSAIMALYFPILPLGTPGLKAPKIVWMDPNSSGRGPHILELLSHGFIRYTDPFKYDVVEINNEGRDYKPGPVERCEIPVPLNYARKFPLEEPFTLYMRWKPQTDGSRENLTLYQTTNGYMQYGWKGPLIISVKGRNITLADFRSCMDFFTTYKNPLQPGGLFLALQANNLRELETTNPAFFDSVLRIHATKPLIEGVEITCEGDWKFLNLEKFVSVEVSNAHPIFDTINLQMDLVVGGTGGATKVSEMIGLPLRVSSSPL